MSIDYSYKNCQKICAFLKTPGKAWKTPKKSTAAAVLFSDHIEIVIGFNCTCRKATAFPC